MIRNTVKEHLIVTFKLDEVGRHGNIIESPTLPKICIVSFDTKRLELAEIKFF